MFRWNDEQNRLVIIVCDLPVCTTRRRMTLPGTMARVGWTADSDSLAYVDATQSNIWIQPLNGRRPHQLTRFTDGRAIVDFAWSRDGQRLAIARVTTTNDIVLFKGLRR